MNLYPIRNGDCNETITPSGFDYGVRLLDLNGDGGPDWLGTEFSGRGARTWDASLVQEPAGNFSLWNTAATSAAWESPVSLRQDGQGATTRFVDVDGNGLVDIVVPGGAYLNRAAKPDMLEQVQGPFGATTNLYYAPHKVFEDPNHWVPDSPVTDGQRRHPYVRWVLTAMTVDPGYGQPSITNEFVYQNAVYDIEDRAFRGFADVVRYGPENDGRKSRSIHHFHTEDALAGQLDWLEVWDVPASTGVGGKRIQRTENEYARAYGDDAEAQVIRPDGSVTPLASVDSLTNDEAFAPFLAHAAGAPDAGGMSFALPLARQDESYEGSKHRWCVV